MTHTQNQPRCTCHAISRPVRQDEEKVYWIHEEDGSPARIYHVHKTWEMTDCDGKTSGLSNFYPLDGQDRHDLWRDCLNAEIFCYADSAELKLARTDDGGHKAEWNEKTDEGYSHWELYECAEPECDLLGGAHQRDHRAEEAGY